MLERKSHLGLDWFGEGLIGRETAGGLQDLPTEYYVLQEEGRREKREEQRQGRRPGGCDCDDTKSGQQSPGQTSKAERRTRGCSGWVDGAAQ